MIWSRVTKNRSITTTNRALTDKKIKPIVEKTKSDRKSDRKEMTENIKGIEN
jgi:hypothetical protein